MEDQHNKHIETFVQEAEELLAEIESAILDIEENPDDKESLDRLFRSVHTIKGSGSMFGFDNIAGFTHHVETTLDKVREGAVPVNSELIDLVLLSRDQIKSMIYAAIGDGEADESVCDYIVSALQDISPSGQEEIDTAPIEKNTKIDDSLAKDANDANDAKNQKSAYRIEFFPDPAIMSSGMDPAILLGEISDLGEYRVVADIDAIPLLDEFMPERCYLGWNIVLSTCAGKKAIKDIFIFVEEDSQVDIRDIPIEVDEPLPLLGEILVERGDITTENVDHAVKSQKKIGELLVDSGDITSAKVELALNEQKVIGDLKTSVNTKIVRVASEKLDNLINLVGELVINQARLTQVASDIYETTLSDSVETLERLTDDLRDCALDMRMMPIGTLFAKFRRLTRDLSAELGKDIELVTEGAETELDKTVIEKLSDPLVHLIRNSIDHGIQIPEERIQAGKPGNGIIRLIAAHQGPRVIITIIDDGAGMDCDILREKAVEKGIIAEDAELLESEIYDLIFTPGFSTAARVTQVSGRGVGMDVVKRDVEALGGTIRISSIKGKGTTILLSLPLTLAIIEGLLVDVGGRRFILPVEQVEECSKLSDVEFQKTHERNLIQLREKLIPFVRLRDIFMISEVKTASEQIAIVHTEDYKAGIIIDEIIGNIQTVIKPLDRISRNAEGISGAAIMGDGTVALIIDIPGLINCAIQEENRRLPSVWKKRLS